MADWFDFNGTRSTALGVYVAEYPPVTLPEERVEFKQPLGRSGSLALLEGDAVYNDVVLSIECFVRDLSKIDQIAAWLRGRGALVLGNTDNRYYDARCVNQLELAKIMRGHAHRSFAAVFRCQPYRYAYPAPAKITINAPTGQSVTNPGNVDAEPLIVVTGTGDIELTIGSKTLLIAGLASSITIDTAAGLAQHDDVNLTGSLTGDWPLTIPPGINAVSWVGDVTKIEITPAWRYR